MMHRMPILRDDHSFREQSERMFRDMQERMGFNSPSDDSFHGFMTGTSGWPSTNTWSTDSALRSLNDPLFFELRPRTTTLQQGTTTRVTQPEVLDDATTRSLFVDLDPQRGQGAGRMFRMSFDVRQYDPTEITIRSEDHTLVVEAKHTDDQSGTKVAREFSRRIQLPQEVDPLQLTSTLSADRILTVQAPIPPSYQAVVNTSGSTQALGDRGTRLQVIDAGQPASTAFQLRASPITVQTTESSSSSTTTSRSRSPLLQTGFVGSQPLRVSPVPFASALQPTMGFGTGSPVAVLTTTTNRCPSPRPLGVDLPTFTVDAATGRRRLDLVLDLGHPYTAEDIVVKVDGRRLGIEAKHESKEHGRVSTMSTQKNFDLTDDVDPLSVRAVMRDDGKISISGFVKM